MSTLVKKVVGSVNDVRVVYNNGRAVSIIRRNGKGYAVDELYSKKETHHDTYTEAREVAMKAPQTA